MNFLVGNFCKRSFSLTGSLLLQMLMVFIFCIIFSNGMLYDVINHVIFLLSWIVAIMPMFCFFFFIFSLANLGFLLLLTLFRNVNIFWSISNSPSVAIWLYLVFSICGYSFILLTRMLLDQQVLFTRLYDLTRREFYILLPLTILIYF